MQDHDTPSARYVAKYVEDLHSLVTHGLKPIAHQVDEARGRDHAETAQLLGTIQQVLRQHEQQLAERLQALGTSPTTGVQDAAAAVAGLVAGIYNQVRTEAVSKSLRDDYTFLSHCSVSWLMLMTTARALGDHATEELAEQGYRDCARLVMQVDRAMPALVVQELQQDDLPAQDVTDWAERIASEAWTRQRVGSTIG
jgi:DNA-binding ferritin-like protein